MYKMPEGEGPLFKKYKHKSDGSLLAMGVRRIVEVNPPSEFYVSAGYTDEDSQAEPVCTRTHTLAPAMTVAELQAQWVERGKARAGSLLAPTDWYVVREAEDASKPVPQTISDYRASVRVASDNVEAAVSALSVYEDLVALNADALWPQPPTA
jgi:hypothetical protein